MFDTEAELSKYVFGVLLFKFFFLFCDNEIVQKPGLKPIKVFPNFREF